MKKPIHIIGSGMAGLLAAVMAAQRGYGDVTVFDYAPSLPNNHHAVLRFKTDAVAKAVGIPFRKVAMLRDVYNSKGVVADALAYSYKTTGTYRSDRSLSANSSGDRYVAPLDFVQQLHDRAVALGVKFVFNSIYGLHRFELTSVPKICTAPQPNIMTLLGQKIEEHRASLTSYDDFFASLSGNYRSVVGVTATSNLKDCDAWVTRYLPHDTLFNRLSVQGNQCIAEANFPKSSVIDFDYGYVKDVMQKAFGFSSDDFDGPVVLNSSKYSKILPIENDKARKAFIGWLTDYFNIYMLGRFATWRPGLLLDALPQDVELILGWIENGQYSTKMKR